MKRLGIILCCLMMVFCFSGMAQAETLKIGTLSPLTGPYAQDGTDILQGVKTAVTVYGKAGGVPGFDKVEVVPGDRQAGPPSMSARDGRT